MHAANICAKNYANGKKSQVDTARRSHPPTESCAYQQFSDAAHLLAVRAPPAYRLHPGCTHQLTHNR